MIGRTRLILEDTHGNILSRDLIGQGVKVVKSMSGPSAIQFAIHHKEPSIQKTDGVGPIKLKPWGHWIHAEKPMFNTETGEYERQIIASGLVKPGQIDPDTGVMAVEAEGFSNYPKGLPWLQNWNPITVDPFEIFEHIWAHIQSYDNGDLGVTVYPTDSGTLMLPGFSFQNEELIQDFFAIFIREIDMLDCGDYLNRLARDIPIDYFERSGWNVNRSAIWKKIELAYPHGGVTHEDIIFRMGENVLNAKQRDEIDLQWTSDVIIRGYFPGKVYSYTLQNADPDRYRRTVSEEDVHINSNERAAAWAHRKLTRRQVPEYWESIKIDPYHPNAPIGSWDVGDTVRVQGKMPWVGEVNQLHRIIGYVIDEDAGICELKLMAEGAFNYDPIEYVP